MALACEGPLFYLDGEPFDMWGLRVPSGANTDADLEGLLGAMDDYAAHGINTITVFYQGSSGGYRQAFAPDGRSVDRHVQARLERIVDAAGQRGMVVLVGIFYQRSDPLESRDAYLRAAALVGRAWRDAGHVAVNVANEQNVGRYRSAPFPIHDPDGIGELCAAVRQEGPELLVGGGGFDTQRNLAIARDPRVDVLWYDDHEFEVTLGRYREQGLTKPHVNVETFGASAAGYVTFANGVRLQGVWPEQGIARERVQAEQPEGMVVVEPARNLIRGKEDFYRHIRTAVEHEGVYVFGHLQAWLQARSRGFPRNRYDLGGYGTVDDPGIRWYLEAVARARDLELWAVPGTTGEAGP